MANVAPEMVSQDTDEGEVEVDELAAALEGTQEKDDAGKDDSGEDAQEKTAEEGDGAGDEETKGEEEVDGPKIDPREIEIRDLRSILREQKKEMSLLKAQVDRASKRATAALDEDSEVLKDEPTVLEQLNTAIHGIGQERGAQLDLLAETMSEMPKYSDIYDVCSKENFNDMFDAIGRGIAQERGIPLDQAVLQAELVVWQQANPYKYMYKMIKEHHPRYVKEETPGATAPKPAGKVVKEKKATVAPASIAGMAGGDSTKSGWTATKIDSLSEDELDKVPAEVYAKYMRNELK